MSEQTVTVRVKLTIEGHELEAGVAVPAGAARLRDVLPVLQNLTDAVVGIAEASAAERGERVSCAKGCGACCRQMVPISVPEAHHLAAVVAGMPGEQAERVRGRFAVALERLERAGLLTALRGRAGLTEAELAGLDVAYFRLGMACPFLEEETCSVHAVRPLACREFLVTSPAAHCANPVAGAVAQLPLGAKVSHALACADGEGAYAWLPLVLALEVGAGEERVMGSGVEVLSGVLGRM